MASGPADPGVIRIRAKQLESEIRHVGFELDALTLAVSLIAEEQERMALGEHVGRMTALLSSLGEVPRDTAAALSGPGAREETQAR
jgi:hypothetical protein